MDWLLSGLRLLEVIQVDADPARLPWGRLLRLQVIQVGVAGGAVVADVRLPWGQLLRLEVDPVGAVARLPPTIGAEGQGYGPGGVVPSSSAGKRAPAQSSGLLPVA
jgi:hypothetical protein